MRIEYGLLALGLALVYGIIKQWLPDFPLSLDTLATFIVYVLLKLGVEVIGAPVHAFLAKRFPRFFN